MIEQSNEWENISRRNVRHLAYWSWGWVLSLASASFGPKFLWGENSGITLLAILISTLLGAGMIVMNRTYINGLDELRRKITMDAMAVALGVGVVGGVAYSLLDSANIISFHAEIGHLILLMSISYLLAFFIGNIRYK